MVTTNIKGDQVIHTTNNGPQNSTVAYNSVNSNQVTADANGNGVNLTVHTGQNSGMATQTAIPTSDIGVANTATSNTKNCEGPGSCK